MRGRNKRYSTEELLEILKNFCREGNKPSRSTLRNPVTPSYDTYRLRFGSLKNALFLLGLGDKPIVKCESCGKRGVRISQITRKMLCYSCRIEEHKLDDMLCAFQG